MCASCSLFDCHHVRNWGNLLERWDNGEFTASARAGQSRIMMHIR